MGQPFWKTKRLEEMTREEWESLCDGCGRCCLRKLRYEEDNSLAFTNIACRLLDTQTCRCKHYATRLRRVPDCVSLTPESLAEIDWLPPSCAYVRIAAGQDLAWWHPLVSGDPETVHLAGVSVRGRVIDERVAGTEEDHIVDWPGRMPPGRLPRASRAARPARRSQAGPQRSSGKSR